MLNIKKMDVISRLQTMEAIWNSFLDEEPEIKSPEWHDHILEERKTRVQKGQTGFVSIKELKANRCTRNWKLETRN
jgi:hypothetical protein